MELTLPLMHSSAKRIFVLGDSHVLSTAWRTIAVPSVDASSECCTLVPCLTTGAKIWHLRKKSSFYTKFDFWQRIDSIPAGSPLILILGEIDCREGVLRAVQKGKYESIEHALRSLIELYIELIREVRKKLPENALYIHPIANVLPETRFLTVAFNKLLGTSSTRTAFRKVKAELLDFDPVLVGGEPSADLSATELKNLQLLPELRLDGTHMSPNYVESHLLPALSR